MRALGGVWGSTARASKAGGDGLLGVLWALLVVQGAITLLSALESLVVALATGWIAVLWPLVLITAAGGALALLSARGLRRSRRWARRVTLVAEWLVLTTGAINLLLSLLLAKTSLDLVPVLTTIVLPITVLVLLRRTRHLFPKKAESVPHEQLVLEGVG